MPTRHLLVRQYKLISVILVFLMVIGLYLYTKSSATPREQNLLKVGILHSRSGFMAIDELPMIDAIMLAINDINESGGLLGKLIDPIIADGASDEIKFAQEAKKLITEHHVSVIFGCWNSSSRRAVQEITDQYQIPFFYSVPYEGVRQGTSTFYIGMTPNQQLLPGMAYCSQQLGNKIFIVGPEEPSMRHYTSFIEQHAPFYKLQILGQATVSTITTAKEAALKIAQDKPSCVVNFLHGQINKSFIDALYEISSNKGLACLSLSLTEQFGLSLEDNPGKKLFAIWPFVQSSADTAATDFVTHFRDNFGATRIVTGPMETSYLAVTLWADAVKQANETSLAAIKSTFKKLGGFAASGKYTVDEENTHLWRTSILAQLNEQNILAPLFQASRWIRPIPIEKENN